jgi:hypothetical protein
VMLHPYTEDHSLTVKGEDWRLQTCRIIYIGVWCKRAEDWWYIQHPFEPPVSYT